MATHYSQYFKLKHRDFIDKGVYNGFLDKDSLLHIDPLLLKNCSIPEFEKSYNNFLLYFQQLVPLVNFTKENNLKDRFFRQIVKRFTMSEIPNTGLGYSKESSYGKGISGALANQLALSAFEIISAGLIDPEIFGLMQLIEDKVGADRISDMTLYILRKDFLAYTQRIATELSIPTKKYVFSYDEIFYVPFYKNKPIHFIPMQLLADLPVALDYDDIDKVCNYNNKLKKKIADIIGVAWSQYKDYKKKDWKKLILEDPKCYNAAIQFYRGLQGIPYNFNVDKKQEYMDLLLQDFLASYPFVAPSFSGENPQQEVYALTKAMCINTALK